MVGALVRQSLQKDIPRFRQQREGAVAAGVLGLILFHSGSYLAYRVTDGQDTPVKVDAVPLKAQQFTAAQAINGGDFHQRIQRVILDGFQEHLQLLCRVKMRFMPGNAGQVHIFTRIGRQQACLDCLSQRLIQNILVQA